MDKKLELLVDSIETSESFENGCKIVVDSLRTMISHFDWVGIYMRQLDDLVLIAWNGPKETEHTRIPIGAGICGLAAKRKETVTVDDVSGDSRYLACFPQTRSELVVPLLGKEDVIGEIDIDSDTLATFTNEDRSLVEQVAGTLVSRYEKQDER